MSLSSRFILLSRFEHHHDQTITILPVSLPGVTIPNRSPARRADKPPAIADTGSLLAAAHAATPNFMSTTPVTYLHISLPLNDLQTSPASGRRMVARRLACLLACTDSHRGCCSVLPLSWISSSPEAMCILDSLSIRTRSVEATSHVFWPVSVSALLGA